MKLDADSRKALIVTAAINLANKAEDIGVITWTSVADACSIATTERTARHHFQKVRNLLKQMSGDSRLCLKCRSQIEDMGLSE